MLSFHSGSAYSPQVDTCTSTSTIHLAARSSAAGLCNAVYLDTWDLGRLLHNTSIQDSFFIRKWSKWSNLVQRSFNSVGLSLLKGVKWNDVRAGEGNEHRQAARAPEKLRGVYLMSSVWVPSSAATETCRRETEIERKARPRLGPQQLPTKALTERALIPLCAGIKPRRKQWEVDRTRPPVRGGGEAAGGEPAHLISLASAPRLPFILLYSLASRSGEGGQSISARAARCCQVSSESGEPTETIMFPSNCHSSPPAALQIH